MTPRKYMLIETWPVEDEDDCLIVTPIDGETIEAALASAEKVLVGPDNYWDPCPEPTHIATVVEVCYEIDLQAFHSQHVARREAAEMMEDERREYERLKKKYGDSVGCASVKETNGS